MGKLLPMITVLGLIAVVTPRSAVADSCAGSCNSKLTDCVKGCPGQKLDSGGWVVDPKQKDAYFACQDRCYAARDQCMKWCNPE